MNLNYVREFLEARKDSITVSDVEQLLGEIRIYQGTESTFTDIAKVMRTINEYNLTFITKVEEYEAYPKNDPNKLPDRMEKVRSILCTISMLHTYLILSISNIKDSTFDMRSISNYIRELNEKKDHFKSEKMAWITVLKSLAQEASFMTEMRRLDIEEEMGYIKYRNK